MKKKGIIIACVAVVLVVCIVLAVVLCVGAKSPKKIAKNLGKAFESSESLEKFMMKNTDFKAVAAMDKISGDSVPSEEDFKNAYKEISKDEEKEAKENMQKSFDESDEDSYKDFVGAKLKTKEIGDLEDNKLLPMFKRMDVTYEKDGEDFKVTIFFYNKKMVTFLPTDTVALLEAFSSMQSGDTGDTGDTVEE